MSASSVFISYSRDTPQHERWVEALATRLKNAGLTVTLDQWHLIPGDDLTKFMESGVSRNDFVVIVCTPHYKKRSDSRVGGVGYESSIISAEILNRQRGRRRFIPVLREGQWNDAAPTALASTYYVDLRGESYQETEYKKLIARLVRGRVLPPTNSGRSEAGFQTEPARMPFDKWLTENRKMARSSVEKFGASGFMEIHFGLNLSGEKTSRELERAARASDSRRGPFPWSIGFIRVTDEFRPRPAACGIFAHVRTSYYAYWALCQNGHFYMLETFPEDLKARTRLFVNFRICRTADALLYCSRLYQNLGVPADTDVCVTMGHHGLKGRVLAYACEQVEDLEDHRASVVDTTSQQIESPIGSIESGLREYVERLTKPMFQFFDFYEPTGTEYQYCLDAFKAGRLG